MVITRVFRALITRGFWKLITRGFWTLILSIRERIKGKASDEDCQVFTTAWTQQHSWLRKEIVDLVNFILLTGLLEWKIIAETRKES